METAPRRTEDRTVAIWLPLVIFAIALGLAAGIGVAIAHLFT